MENVTSVEVPKDSNTAIISMNKHIALGDFQKSLGGKNSKYDISSLQYDANAEQAKSWLEIYKPILLIFGYISAVTLLIQRGNNSFDFMQWMGHFMVGFLDILFFK